MKVAIGIVAVIDGKPYSGGEYRSGTKCYKTEGIARAAVSGKAVRRYAPDWKAPEITYAPAYIEVPDKEPTV